MRALADQAPNPDAVLAAVTAPSRPGRGLRARRRPLAHRRLLAPVATAGAVALALVATTLTLGRGPGTGQLTADQILAAVPRYYVALTGPVNGPYHAVVGDALSGTSIATLAPPAPEKTFDAVTAAADDRTFVLAAQRGGPGEINQATEFFLGRLDPGTGSFSITPMSIPELPKGTQLTGLALSPDGSRLAVAVGTGHYQRDARLMVYSLPAGPVKTWWSNPGTIGDNDVNPNSISWGPGDMLAVNTGPTAQNYGVRLLDTAGPGGSLLAHSRLLVSQNQPDGYTFNGVGVLAPDGQLVVAPMSQVNRALSTNKQLVMEGEYEEFSGVTGGRLTAVLYTARSAPDAVFWVSSSGSLLVVSGHEPAANRLQIGVFTAGRFVPVRGPASGSGVVDLAF